MAEVQVRVTTEAVIGAITSSRAAPRTLLLGRYEAAGRLYVGRSTRCLRPPAASCRSAGPTGGHSSMDRVDIECRVADTAHT